MGRAYILQDGEQAKLTRDWEQMWDTAYGDLVGSVLGMQ